MTSSPPLTAKAAVGNWLIDSTTTDCALVAVAPPLSVTVRVRAKVRADGKVREKLAAVETVLPAASFHA